MEYLLSLVIPVYNEQFTIKATVEKIIHYFSNKNFYYELILVNDGSTDKTRDIIYKLKETLESKSESNPKNYKIIILENKKNRGKGYSVRRGILESRGKFVLFTDADSSIPIEESKKLLSYLKDGFNIAIGSKWLKDSIILGKPKRMRKVMGVIFNFFVRKIINLEYKDTQCGFKCFDRKAVDLIFPLLKINDFSFDVEILYLAKRLNLKVKEVPVKFINCNESKVKIVKDSIKMFISLLKIKKLHSNLTYLPGDKVSKSHSQ